MPPSTVVPLAPAPEYTNSTPPLPMIAPTAEPYTPSWPPLLIVVALATPPLSTT